MEVVKITKRFRNGIKEHNLVLADYTHSTQDIEYLVDEWCSNEPSGQNNGYTFEWLYVEDSKVNDALRDRVKILNIGIDALIVERDVIIHSMPPFTNKD